MPLGRAGDNVLTNARNSKAKRDRIQRGTIGYLPLPF
jgi:hypothetical protein